MVHVVHNGLFSTRVLTLEFVFCVVVTEASQEPSYQAPSYQEFNSLSPRTPPTERKVLEAQTEAERVKQIPKDEHKMKATEDSLENMASRIKALAASDSDEDTLNSAGNVDASDEYSVLASRGKKNAGEGDLICISLISMKL